jgi:co-chaperonin GroES (HSP10)
MLQLTNYFLIHVPHVYDEGIVAGISKMNRHIYIDRERDRYERKITKGTIYQVPIGYTEDKLMPLDLGLPAPKFYIGHDDIQRKMNEGMDWDNRQYNPSSRNDLDWLTYADYGALIACNQGDTVYFHPRVTEEENLFATNETGLIFKAGVLDLFFAAGTAQGGYVIVAPHEAEKEIGGIQLSTDTEFQLGHGTVKHVSKGSSLKQGEVVYFLENADYQVEIEGEIVFAMREDEIILKACSV